MDLENLTKGGFTSGGLLKSLMGWGALGGIATLLFGIIAKRTGKDDPLEFLPEPVKKFLDGIVNWINSMLDKVFGFIRGKFFKEEDTALKDVNARLDKVKPAFDKIDQAAGISGAGTEIHKLAKESAQEFLKLNMSTDPNAVLENTHGLYDKIQSHIVQKLKEQNKNWTPADEKRFTTVGADVAAYITGEADRENANPNLLTTGYGGMLMEIQTGVKAKGDYKAPADGNIVINNTGIGQIIADLKNTGTSAAPAAAPAAPLPGATPQRPAPAASQRH